MAFFSLVPFEDQIWLIKAEESQSVSPEDLEKINEHLKNGKAVQDIQDVLEDVWTKK